MTPDDVVRGTSPTSESSHTSQNSEYATWLTKQQAAGAIGVSTKTIEQWATEGKLQQAAYRPQNRGPLKAVYHPDDVRRIATERRGAPTAFVLPAVRASNGNGHGPETGITPITPLTPTPTGEDVLRLVFAMAHQALTSQNPRTSENSEKFLLTVAEAAACSGETARDLRKAIRSGELPARHKERRDWRTWRIRRKDLEAL
jgi:hypothetical protein